MSFPMVSVERKVAGIPKNVVVPWYGNEADCPAGWSICDGRARPAGSDPANTPDLTTSYVKGASADGDVGDTGGETSHQHGAPVGYLGSNNQLQLKGNDAPWGTEGIGSRTMEQKGYSWATGSSTVKKTSSTAHEPPYYRLWWIMKD